MFQLAAPFVLCLLPAPWLIGWLLPPSKFKAISGLPVPFFHLLAQHDLFPSNRTQQPHLFYFFTLIWMLLVLALAGPQWLGEPIYATQQGRNIFLVLDISGSMALPDMQLNHASATRLEVVKQAAKDFVRARQPDHMGLILFGSEAYLQTPLTYDHHAILKRIEDATVGLAGKTTSLGDAIGLAIKKLQTTPVNGRIIILLTDGSNNSGVLPPIKAAEIARTEHIKIYTIGLSTENNNQRIMQLFLSMQGGADLDEDTLKSIAHLTQGHYFRATDPVSLHQIYKTIDQLEAVKQTARPFSPKTECYPWLIGLCLLLLSAWLIRRNQ